MKRALIAAAVALAVVATPRPALADCPEMSCEPADTVDMPGSDTPPSFDADGDPIPYVQEGDAPVPGASQSDGVAIPD